MTKYQIKKTKSTVIALMQEIFYNEECEYIFSSKLLEYGKKDCGLELHELEDLIDSINEVFDTDIEFDNEKICLENIGDLFEYIINELNVK